LPTPTEPAAQTRAGGSGWRNHRSGRRPASVNQERFAGRPNDNSGDHIPLSSSCMVAISAVWLLVIESARACASGFWPDVFSVFDISNAP